MFRWLAGLATAAALTLGIGTQDSCACGNGGDPRHQFDTPIVTLNGCVTMANMYLGTHQHGYCP
jgi:hypothetical protein